MDADRGARIPGSVHGPWARYVHPAAFHAFAPVWQPLFWNLAEQTPQQLLETGQEWLQALAVVRAQDEKAVAFADVFGEAARRLAALGGTNRVRWYDLMRVVMTYASWRRPEPERSALLAVAQAVNDDVVRKREIAQMSEQIGATIADLAMAKGREQGEAKGRQEGRQEACRENLRALLEDRFGTLSEEVLQRIAHCDDLERLQAAVRQAWRVQRPDEIAL